MLEDRAVSVMLANVGELFANFRAAVGHANFRAAMGNANFRAALNNAEFRQAMYNANLRALRSRQ